LNEVLEVLQIRGLIVKLLQVLEYFQKSIDQYADKSHAETFWGHGFMKYEQHFDAAVVQLRAVLNARDQWS
jgi:hypothetical protein